MPVQIEMPIPRADWSPVGDRCPMARLLDLISTKSAFLVMREAFYGATRFEQFVDRAEISEPVAAARLRELTASGLLEKVPYQEPGQRTRHEYHVTEKGADLVPVFISMVEYGAKWLFEDESHPEFVHVGCGGHVAAELRCEHAHAVGIDELRLRRAHT